VGHDVASIQGHRAAPREKVANPVEKMRKRMQFLMGVFEYRATSTDASLTTREQVCSREFFGNLLKVLRRHGSAGFVFK
jgi:hypothetical protein